MKLACLSSNPSKPCFILYFKGVTLMLDCGLDVKEVLKFLPLPVVKSSKLSQIKRWIPPGEKSEENINLMQELKEIGGNVFIDGMLEFSIPEVSITDLSQVDAILVSNHNTILALPYITEYSGFQGIVYCTEPTLQMGRQYMEELVTYVERNPKTNICSQWKSEHIVRSLPGLVKDSIRQSMWKKLYTLHDIHSSLARVQLVGYNEKRDVFGALTVLACSSGYSIGSSNWVITSEFEKICYVAGTSTLTTHPKPVDQAPLRNSDVLILSCLTQTPTANPDAMIGEFCVNAAVTIKNGGNVLVPCYPSGITYDLFECLSGHLDTCGLSTIPMYFLSPVSDSALAYSNIFAEWLSAVKQSKVYLPEPPFPHAELLSPDLPSTMGYRLMTDILRQNGVHVRRDTVMQLMKELDPTGVQRRRKRRIQRKIYRSSGPNHAWHIDGYDKLKPYGFPIHGCIDGYSRKIMWLSVDSTNNDPAVVAHHFVTCVNNVKGCPLILQADPGTENSICGAIQCVFRHQAEDFFSGINSFRVVRSKLNQRIEAWWSMFRRQTTEWWIVFFKDLESFGGIRIWNDNDLFCARFCFMPVIQRELDLLVDRWNNHYISASRNAECPNGRPNVIYDVPEQKGGVDCLQEVEQDDIDFALSMCTVPCKSGSRDFDLWAENEFATRNWNTADHWQDALKQYFELRDTYTRI